MAEDGWSLLADAARRVEAERLNGLWWRTTPKKKPRRLSRSLPTIDWGDTEIDFARRRKELLAETGQHDDEEAVGG